MSQALLKKPSTQADTPRIYVACLASYNAGRLHGTWIEVDGDVDDLQEAIQTMLASSPEPDAEEWAIHDFEGFGEVHIQEYTSLGRLCEMAELIREHGDLATHVIDHFGDDVDAARQALADEYQGRYDSLEDYAHQFMEETGQLTSIPDNLRNYIDFESMGKDFDLNGDIFTIETGHTALHVFWNR